MLVKDWLGELGCGVVGPACTVADGLALAVGQLDGAIFDVNLAGDTCFPLANALRSRGVPVAFATGQGFKDALILRKPFDFEGVKSVLGKMLSWAASSACPCG